MDKAKIYYPIEAAKKCQSWFPIEETKVITDTINRKIWFDKFDKIGRAHV